jgi:hypothetical protein
MERGVPLGDLARVPIATPSRAEAIGLLARLALKEKLTAPLTKRIIRFLRIFG